MTFTLCSELCATCAADKRSEGLEILNTKWVLLKIESLEPIVASLRDTLGVQKEAGKEATMSVTHLQSDKGMAEVYAISVKCIYKKII